MPQSLAQLYTHLIFSTKNRQPILAAGVHEPLRAYIGGILRNLASSSIATAVLADHIHLLYSHSRNIAPADLVKEVKGSSSKWLKTQGLQYRRFRWQRGYGIFSVSASRLDSVTRYIERQESHHRKVTFQEEYRKFLQEYGVPCDEPYVWD